MEEVLSILTLNKITLIIKELFKNSGSEITYNEFLVITSIDRGMGTLSSLQKDLLIDQGQIARILKKLVDKGLIIKLDYRNKDAKRYITTTVAHEELALLRANRSILENDLTNGISLEVVSTTKETLEIYEKRLQKFTFNYIEDLEI